MPDPGDASVAALIADLDQADLGRDLSELRELELARARLADGSYGICIDCGREDQTLYETTHVSSRGPSLEALSTHLS